jgi:8-oxo-dGTP pyrophosphatase MutT (NUDIX family)
MAGLPASLAIAVWLVGVMWIVALTARYFGFSSDLVWFVLFLGTGVAAAEWHASRSKTGER